MKKILVTTLMLLLVASACGSPPTPTPLPTPTQVAPPTAAAPVLPTSTPTKVVKSGLSKEALLISSMAGLVTDVDAMQAHFSQGTTTMATAELKTSATTKPIAFEYQRVPQQPLPSGFVSPLPGTGKIAAPAGACPAGAKPVLNFKLKDGNALTVKLINNIDGIISYRYFIKVAVAGSTRQAQKNILWSAETLQATPVPAADNLMAYMESLVTFGDQRLITPEGWNEALWNPVKRLQTPATSLMDYQVWTVSPAIEKEVADSFVARLNSMGVPPMVIDAFKRSNTSGWLAKTTPTANSMLAKMEIEAELAGSLEGRVYETRDVSIPAPHTAPIFGPQTGSGDVIWNHPTEGRIPFKVELLLNEFDDLGRAVGGSVKGVSKESSYEFAIQFKKDGTKEGELTRGGVKVGKLTMTVDAEKFHNYLNLETNQEEKLTKPTQQ